MPLSQNLRFTNHVPADSEDRHAATLKVVSQLAEMLRSEGWEVDEPEDWRDSGWSVDCQRQGSSTEVILCEFEPGEWMLQIAPASVPGFVGKLFGAKVSATDDDVYNLSVAVSKALLSVAGISNPRWCWDAFPEAENSTPEPILPQD